MLPHLRQAATQTAWRHRLGGDRGATAVEYAIMASLIAAVIAGAVGALGLATFDLFDNARQLMDTYFP